MSAPDSVPVFRPGMRLRHDETRGVWMLLGPERLFQLDDAAADVLRLVDGKRSVGEIIDDLVQEYAAPKEEIAADVVAMLDDLAGRGVLKL
jgi:pyrroloquinoline quinone biosynthesis protein D